VSICVLKVQQSGPQETSGQIALVGGETAWLNSNSLLPPVGCPLMVEIPELEALVEARRTGFIGKKSDDMEYELFTGRKIHGRLRWTYP